MATVVFRAHAGDTAGICHAVALRLVPLGFGSRMRRCQDGELLENPPVNLRYGNGWAILDASCYSGRPGVHDIGAALELSNATILLLILRAAESWAPESDDVTHPDAIVCREGRIRVQFADGSMRQLDPGAAFLPITRPLLSVSNLGTSIADVLLIARKAG